MFSSFFNHNYLLKLHIYLKLYIEEKRTGMQTFAQFIRLICINF